MTCYVSELVDFPDLMHGDRCDATAMALQLLRTRVEPARAMWRAPVEVRRGYA